MTSKKKNVQKKADSDLVFDSSRIQSCWLTCSFPKKNFIVSYLQTHWLWSSRPYSSLVWYHSSYRWGNFYQAAKPCHRLLCNYAFWSTHQRLLQFCKNSCRLKAVNSTHFSTLKATFWACNKTVWIGQHSFSQLNETVGGQKLIWADADVCWEWLHTFWHRGFHFQWQISIWSRLLHSSVGMCHPKMQRCAPKLRVAKFPSLQQNRERK